MATSSLLPDYSMCLALSIIFTLFSYKYNLLSFVENFFIKKNQSFFCSDNRRESIELITNNLVQNLSSYEAFYNYYTTDFRPNNQYFANLYPYMEEILLALEANAHLQSIIDIKMLDNSISSKLTAFYKKAQAHLCKLKDWLEYSKTNDLKYYQQFGVPHSSTIEDIKSKISTVDIVKDFNNYVDYDYVPKIKNLIEEVRELINILRSKHIT